MKEALVRELGPFLGEILWKEPVSKLFNFAVAQSFQDFSRAVHAFVEQDAAKLKMLLFTVVDRGRDLKVCERDIFETLRTCHSLRSTTAKLLTSDIKCLASAIQSKMTLQGKAS